MTAFAKMFTYVNGLYQLFSGFMFIFMFGVRAAMFLLYKYYYDYTLVYIFTADVQAKIPIVQKNFFEEVLTWELIAEVLAPLVEWVVYDLIM